MQEYTLYSSLVLNAGEKNKIKHTTLYTEPKQAILQAISQIPLGKVSTYGQIATISSQIGKARYVGFILKNLPPESSIPWHRVVNSQGKSSFPINSEKHTLQLQLLSDEDIKIEKNRISLKKYLWP